MVIPWMNTWVDKKRSKKRVEMSQIAVESVETIEVEPVIESDGGDSEEQ